MSAHLTDAGGAGPLDPAAVEQAVTDAIEAVARAADLDQLKQARLAHQGERSRLALANRAIGALAPDRRAEAGRLVGSARGRVAQALRERQAVLELEREARLLEAERVDVSLPTGRRPQGARHPLELTREWLEDAFVALGWEIAEGPEVESEWFNFDALNLGPDHPARQLQDTFYVDPPGSGLVLRTQTSPIQVRALLERGVPLYVAGTGKVFRTDELDATHTPVFHQIEGLAVDQGLTMAHLRGALGRFVEVLYGRAYRTRMRPSYFPFTEPSAELDSQCYVCLGEEPARSGCRTCKRTGWVELGGCGMVNRNVLLAAGVDPERYTGFAFGLGIERSLMFRNSVAGMHDIIEGDVRFSRQFGMEI